ncbi:MAG: DUF1934 domain-containing protein [Eubacteriales bacterium]|nr:DUF1934 domain-containing protein [Eubacteriales bacterium]
MTKDVLVSVRGMHQMTEDEDELELISPGRYLNKGGRHYIHYEEAVEGEQGTIRNLIKGDERKLEVVKSGLLNSSMVFEAGKKNLSCYQTPFGDMMVGVTTKEIRITEEEEHLSIRIQYALELNYEHQADCRIQIHVKPQRV